MRSIGPIFLALLAGVLVWPYQTILAHPVRCNRTYISGLEVEHARGLAILGPETVTDPKKMSIYVTIATDGKKNELYVQSNYKEHPDEFPIKIIVDEKVDLNRVLSWIPVAKKNVHVDAKGITFYVDPSFFEDPTYGKYKKQMTGTVVRLTGGEADFAGKPSAYDYYEVLGQMAAAKKDYPDALKDYGKAIQADASRLDAYVERAQCYYALDRCDRAMADIKEALSLKPDDLGALYFRCFIHLRQKKDQEAFLDVNQLIHTWPKFEPGYLCRARMYDQGKKYDRALKDYDQAIFLKDSDATAHFYRGLYYIRTRQYDKADKDLEKTLQLKPDYPKAKELWMKLEKMKR